MLAAITHLHLIEAMNDDNKPQSGQEFMPSSSTFTPLHITHLGAMVIELFPRYDSLPELVKGYKCSWDYFNATAGNPQGERDALGTVSSVLLTLHFHADNVQLNFITTGTRRHALTEVISGESVSLE